ncbi:MAG: GmrSD restriction endonuclease domain-containing protein [Pseudonocardiaceae bacterium]
MPRLEALAHRVLTGDVILPKFQRQFVWSRQQILDLLDSVSRNYPIGSVLLWQSAERLASERTVAELDVEPQRHGYPVNYILDGQQRLASICGALYWRPDGDPESKWNIVYDLERQEFRHVTTFDDPSPHLMPTRLLSEPSEFFGRAAQLSDQDLAAQAKTLFDRFTNYQIAVVTLRGMAVDEVAKVFERINSTHTPLTVVDLMRAATWTPTFDLQEEIDTLLTVLDRKKYGRVDSKTVLRTIAASAGFGFAPHDMQRLRELTPEQLQSAVADAAEAAKRAVDFLTTEIGTPRASALPYLNQFAVLVDIFRQVPKPTSAQHEAIKRWFWLTASGEYFKGWNTRQMVDDRHAVRAFAQGTAEIEVSTGLPRDVLWRRSQFRTSNAPAKLLGLLLAGADPVDLRNGQRIDTDRALSWQNDKEFHHFFPKAFLKTKGVSSARANVCANLIMLTSVSNIFVSDQPPSVYLKDMCDTDGEEAVRERLARSLVTDAAYEAARRDDYEAFLEVRSRTLHERLMALIGPTGGTVSDYAPFSEDADVSSDDGEPVDRDSAD